MKKLTEKLVAFIRDEEGLTMVEYAVAGSLVTAGCVVAFTGLGTAISGGINYLAGLITTS